MIARLRANEPVRLVAYPALAAVVLYLVGRGVFDAELGDLIVGIVALVLGVPAAEYARAQVTPPNHLGEAIVTGAESLLDQVDAEVGKRFGPAGTAVLDQIRDRVAEARDGGLSSGRHRAGQ